jgi:predicted XRE-type DNA-binding protein
MTERVVKGSGNVFQDIGFENADEMLVRAELTHQIYKIIKERGLKQREAARILGLKQPDVSDLMNGKFKDFSLERLLALLRKLDRDIEIVISPTPRNRRGSEIHVSAV